MDVVINYFAVVVATVLNIVIGFLWYGPVFGKPWMKEMGFTAEHMREAQAKGMTQSYVIMAVAALVLNYVLAHVLVQAELAFGMLDVSMAMVGAFWMWLGFIATTMTGQVLWEGKSWRLYALNVGYYLVALEVAAIIIATWR
jgi:hypothetical protein